MKTGTQTPPGLLVCGQISGVPAPFEGVISGATYPNRACVRAKIPVLRPEAFMPTLIVNGKSHDLDVEPEMPLLWAIRSEIGLTGTKYGCGIAQCGACTVIIDGKPTRSCVTPVSAVAGKQITTIEGLSKDGNLNKVQEAWIAEDVPQCGYCQSGQIMTATALLNRTPNPDDSDIDAAMAGNICRCGTYVRIRRAIHRAATKV
jgi:aerobic-type carbon monoxide dehydrogenase small subunit (CoxS/CutS family)